MALRSHRPGAAPAERDPLGGRPNPPVTIQGEGVVETFAWETGAGFALHVLNYTNPAMHRGWIRNFYPIGPQKVSLRLPAGRQVTRVELLRAGNDIHSKPAPARLNSLFRRCWITKSRRCIRRKEKGREWRHPAGKHRNEQKHG